MNMLALGTHSSTDQTLWGFSSHCQPLIAIVCTWEILINQTNVRRQNHCGTSLIFDHLMFGFCRDWNTLFSQTTNNCARAIFIMHLLLCPFFALLLLILVGISFAQQNASSVVSVPKINLRIGIIIPENETDYEMQRQNAALITTGGAIPIALDRLWRDGSLSKNVNFSFVWRYEKCRGGTTAGYAYEMFTRESVDALVAPPCPMGVASALGTYFNVPVLLWANTMASALVDPERYKTNLNIMPNYADYAKSILDTLELFGWNSFGFVYQSDENGGAGSFARDLNSAMKARQNTTLAFQFEVDTSNKTATRNTTSSAVNSLKSRARIILLCFDDIRELRRFALALADAGMDTQEYLYIYIDHDLFFAIDMNRPQFYVQQRQTGKSDAVMDGRDEDAKRIGRRSLMFHLDLAGNGTVNLAANFTTERVMRRIKQWPFELTTGSGMNMSAFAPFLHDLFYMYGLALGRIYNESSEQELTSTKPFRDGQRLTNYSRGTFEGVTGSVRVAVAGNRRANFALSSRFLNVSNGMQRFLLILPRKDMSTNFTFIVADNNSIWLQWDGTKPMAVPICGFSGNSCPISPWEQFKEYFISGGTLAVLAILCCTVLTYYIIRTRLEEIRRLDASWCVPFSELTKWKKQKAKEEKSARSLSSGPSQQYSQRSGYSNVSLWNHLHDRAFTLRDEKCVTQKLASSAESDAIFGLKTLQELRMMRQMDHENLNRFLGICTEVPVDEQLALGPNFALWRFCPRGSLSDMLADGRLGKFAKDAVFIKSLATEIVEGLYFLHNSPIQYHGRLHPTHCLLDQNWKVKLTQFGLIALKGPEIRSTKDKLWLSPELLRRIEYNQNAVPTCPSAEQLRVADIYALGLLLCEMVNVQPCWEEAIQEETSNDSRPRRGSNGSVAEERRADALLTKIRRGGVYPKRPDLVPQLEGLNPGLLLLIRDCWKEEASERPKLETVRSVLRQLEDNLNRRRNVMDHVFSLLEDYATKMESEVEERTRELAEEKAKADTLLCKLLPREVASRLKLGESVPPDHFDCASVFFSDLVSFTQLSSRLSPLGTVNVINQLFTTFDAIIEEHDAYKVETIGDGYLCVSGLPQRNGNEHARHIGDMALKFVDACNHFMLPELRGEKVRLRVGIHTGPVVAGVVGLTMPRYCLFGDTVNTASRMESNSLPDRIQVSPEANRFLTEIVGGYRTESRGEVIIKGKGVMQTFWLLGHTFD